jgi:hypothetical protein
MPASMYILGFYLEENLDVIIKRVNGGGELREFFNDKKSRKPFGLKNKFGWFYSSYIAPFKLQKSSK